ncbi:hypothetical protein [Streptomyces sp. NPDC048481]|uniref:hypothetical protein n=1 Tax=Streptomyces sp. NPDC048481 TaxID=3365557 RepID=UPI00371FC442
MSYRLIRRTLVGLLAAVGIAAGGTAAATAQARTTEVASSPQAATGHTAVEPQASLAGLKKVWLSTVVTQWTHFAPEPSTHSHAGTLYIGSNYFYCWTEGAQYANNGHSSPIWLLTDDDSGNKNVWVSAVNLTSIQYYDLFNLLRRC